MKETILYPGQYSFLCECGGFYETLTVTRKKTIQNYCWYCGGQGKHVKLMELDNLDFSYNWNGKLNCEAFSTIRLRNDKKYYLGAKKVIRLKGVVKGEATIVAVSHFTLDKINESVSRLDTGYSAEECRKIIMNMYKNRPVIDWFSQQLVFCILAYCKKTNQDSPDLFDQVNE